MNNTPIDIFVHIPKCGGTTLHSIISQNYQPGEIYHYKVAGRRTSLTFKPGLLDIDNFLVGLNYYKDTVKCIVGHIPYGAHEYIDRPCHYFSMLREPAARVWSQFNAIVINPYHYLYPTLAQYGFDLKAALAGGVIEFCNDQSRMVGDVNEYISVGLLEQFDVSIQNFSKALGWAGRLEYSRLNVGAHGDVPEDVRRAIWAANGEDVELYEKVKAKY